MSESLEVWLDADFVGERLRVGTLAHDRGTVRFSYEPTSLQHPLAFGLDPDLSLGEGAYYPKPEQGNFRIFDGRTGSHAPRGTALLHATGEYSWPMMHLPRRRSLRELETVARELTAKRIDDLNALRRWLAVLVAPGASLGGARPKANFTDSDGSLWIAKFPARDDERDVGACFRSRAVVSTGSLQRCGRKPR